VWKEAVVVCFEALCQRLSPAGIEKTQNLWQSVFVPDFETRNSRLRNTTVNHSTPTLGTWYSKQSKNSSQFSALWFCFCFQSSDFACAVYHIAWRNNIS
jgi:hypothetical protein